MVADHEQARAIAARRRVADYEQAREVLSQVKVG
jgi:hypothetical protein